MKIKNKILYEFYRNIYMLNTLKMPLYENTKYRNNCYSWEYNLIYKYDLIEINIRKNSYSMFEDYTWSIYVKNIEVYNNYDGWLHEVPKEMTSYVSTVIDKIRLFNKECKDNKIEKSFNEYLKAEENKKEQTQIEKHEKEKQELIKTFKGK